MARLLTDAEVTPGTSSTAGVMGEASETRGKVHNVTSRRLSFKTRQTPRSYRSTKVTLSSSNVSLIASKFNTIVIEDDKKGRALLRRLSSQRRPSVPKADAKKVEISDSVKAAIQLFEQKEEPDPDQKLTKTKPKLVLIRKNSSNKSQARPDSNVIAQISAKNEISAKLDSEVDKNSAKESVKSVDFQRKPSLKAKPQMRNTNRPRYTSDLGLHFNQRIAKFNSLDEAQKVESNKIVDNVKHRSLGLDISQRIERFSVHEDFKFEFKSTGKGKVLMLNNEKEKEKSVRESKEDTVDNMELKDKHNIKNEHIVKSMTRKMEIIGKDITENNENVIEKTKRTSKSEIIEQEIKKNVDTVGKSMKETNDSYRSVNNESKIGAVEKENKSSEVRKFPVGIDQSKQRLALNVKDNNTKPKVHPKPNVITTEKRISTLYSEKLASTESIKVFKSAPVLKDSIKESGNSKRLSIPKDPTILDHVFDADEPKENKINSAINKVRPNSSFLWRSNSSFSFTEIPLQDNIEDKTKGTLTVGGNREAKVPPPTKPKVNGFKTSEISIVNGVKEPNIQVNGYKSELLGGTNGCAGSDVNRVSVSKEQLTNSLNTNIADSFMMEMNEHIEKRFSSDIFDYEFIYNKGNEIPVVNKQSTLNSLDRSVQKHKSNENLQKLLVEELVSRNLSSEYKRRSAEFADKFETPVPKVPPPTLNRNRSPARGNTLDRTVPGPVAALNMVSKIGLPPPVLRHLKKNRQVQVDVKEEKSTPVEDYFSSEFSQYSDHYTLVGGDESVAEMYEDIGGQENSYAVIKEYEDEQQNIYDDVLNMHGQPEDHYESISPVAPAANQPDSDSSCDQNNSLYGMRPSSRSSSGGIYQMTGPGSQPIPRSETSDEWMDLDNSDDQNERIVVYRDRPTRSWSSAGGWSQKVRRQWSKRAGNGHTIGVDDGSDGSSPRPYKHVEEDESTLCDDFDDSFDSDSSADDATEARSKDDKYSRVLPEPPRDGIYGFMKQAGKRMRKHWPLGKSLRRIGKINIITATSGTNSSDQGKGTTNLNRKRWPSFKSKSKPLVQNQSTFYLNSTSEESEQQSVPEVTNYGESRVDPRRLSTASMIRPSSPPPPPPPPRNPTSDASKRSSFLDDSERKTSVPSDDTSKRISSIITGDETGKRASLISSLTKELISTFDKNDSNSTYVEGQQRLTQTSNSNWYLDISWPSNDSASEHGSSQGSDLHLTFADEPLYQFYAANVAEMSRSELNCEDSDGYEEIASLVNRPSAMDLITPHHRTLWCEILEVKQSGIFDQLSPAERKLQEAKFEVMTSEASYFKSLTVLDKHFASCPIFADETILPSQYRKILFSNVNTVRKCSEKLLAALEVCWQESILLSGLCKILYDHVKNHFYIYIKYCSNQIYIDKTLKKLRSTNANFNDILTQLEADPQCQSLCLHSFLMLPMQRITRMPLLVDAILSRLSSSDPEFSTCELLLATLNKVVADCNEGARRQERYEEMLKLSQQLEFSREVRTLPILSPLRWLIRSGQLMQVNMDAKLTFGRRLARTGPKITLFLFTDILVVAKKKGEESYLVVDHCQRNLVQMSEFADVVGSNRYLLVLTMLENHEMKTVEMLLSCESETMRQRWLQAVTPPISSNPEETVYEDWDCPQVSAIHVYSGDQPDELSLQPGDVVNVFRKMGDGWYYGQRIRDGESGWFPANHSVEIASMHVRAKNLKQRWRFLALSGNYVEELKRKSKI